VKKLLLVLGALVMTVSGVAMVSAYEAHTVNVRAKVENALHLDRAVMDFGTVFPEEWFTEGFKVIRSTSFCEVTQGGRTGYGDMVDAIDYEVWVVRKPVESPPPEPYPNPVEDIDGVNYYYWLGDALYIGIFNYGTPLDPALMYPDDADISGHGALGVLKHVTTSTAPILTGTITKSEYGAPNEWYDNIVVGLDVPVFASHWNQLTDVPIKPSGRNGPTLKLTGDRNVQGIVLGADIVIQVTRIYKWTP